MKKALCLVVFGLLTLLSACQQKQAVSESDKETIAREIKSQFQQFIDAVNRKDAAAWAQFYSQDAFLAAVAGVDRYDSRKEWVEVITRYFSERERQSVSPVDVKVAVLNASLALLSSREITETTAKSGETIQSDHVFSLLWQKELGGWKIIHSHESWVDKPAK